MTILTRGKYKSLDSDDVIVFILGLLALFFVNAVGQLYLSEILLFLFAPILWLRSGKLLLNNVDAKKILGLGVLWFFGQALTDILRQTPVLDLARGWAGIIVLLFNFSSLYLLLGNNIRRIKLFIFGFAISGVISSFVQPSSYILAEPWKFGFGVPIALFVLLFVIRVSDGQIERMRKWIWLILVFGALSFILNARSLGGTIMLSGAILWLRTSPFTWRFFARVRPRNLFIGILLIGGIGLGLLRGYAYAAGNGFLGEKIRTKFEFQDNGSVWGLILGGRYEILGASQAILDSPIIGHGSWARGVKYRLYIYQMSALGFEIEPSYMDYYVSSTDLIPAHSHLAQGWIWAGILGAIFWGWVLIFIAQTLIKENSSPNELYPLVIYFGTAAVWDILFSPLGSFMRILWALRFIVFLCVKRTGEN